jgi:hypothetical protein
MLARKLAVLIAALAVSAPALADRGHRDYRHGHRVVQQPHYVAYRPVVQHYQYRPAPRRVVVVHRPQPVYQYSHPNTGAAILVGAVLGAAIVHHAIAGY